MVKIKNILNVRLATDTIPPILNLLFHLKVNRYTKTNRLGERNLYFIKSDN